jgi:hypothetical protein
MKRPYANMLGKSFYQKTGSLFFAFANADGIVHPKEVAVLKRLVREIWLPLDDIEDDYGTDAAFQIEIVFDWLMEEDKESDDCFDEFSDFYKEHTTMFTEPIKKLIFETSSAIANSFSGKNKAELILLGKLSLLFTGAI